MADKPLVVASLADHELYVKIVEEHFRVVWWEDYIKGPEKYNNDIQGILVDAYGRLKRVDGSLLDHLPNLKIVSTLSVGTDHLDLELLFKRGIKVSRVPDVSSDCVADWGITLLVGMARRIVEGVDSAKNPATPFDFNIMGKKITGSTIGVVGFGRIGYKIAERAYGFSMKVLYYDVFRRSEEEEKKIGATYYSSVDEMLPHCDFVILIVPLLPTTRGMIGKKQFELMKDSAILVNVARAQVIDQDALVEALKNKTIRSAAIDVTYPEPLPDDHPLRFLDNIIITPHMGANSEESRRGVVVAGVKSCIAGVKGEAIPNEVQPPTQKPGKLH
uniref:Glyoxylate reductase/hydroxypyruvate reductase n=1 Tax=Branchiostoma floridae TaxID=7739 RepID=C3ZPH6_BRAFL|eukprot:XP_002589534.1 hypothetical protein BRAFLDRAFT_97033 [Branchiostoma floridae]